jgi:GR25 family glycosyltransferase involved in LPS biosynthesis
MMGCAISHYRVLKKIVEESIPCALVLEDDFLWYDQTVALLNRIQFFQKGIIKLSCIGSFCSADEIDYQRLCENPSLMPEKAVFPIGNGSYLLHLADAKKLYEHLDKVVYHIDVQYSYICKTNDIDLYHYPCIGIMGFDDSTIGNQKETLLGKILPISSKNKWWLTEPFMVPFGYSINIYLSVSIMLIVVGTILICINQLRILGIIFILIGLVDLLVYSVV